MMKPTLTPIQRYFADIDQAFGLVNASLLRNKEGLGEIGYDYLQRKLTQCHDTIPKPPLNETDVSVVAYNDNDSQSPKMAALKALKAFATTLREEQDPMSPYNDPRVVTAVINDVNAAMLSMAGERTLTLVGR